MQWQELFFAFTSEVIKRKRIYWFGTFPWNKCEKQFSQNLAHKNANQFNEANFYDIRLIACAMVLHSVSGFFGVFCSLSSKLLLYCYSREIFRGRTLFLCISLFHSHFIENNANELPKYPLWAILAPDFCQEYDKIKNAIIVFSPTWILSPCFEGNFYRGNRTNSKIYSHLMFVVILFFFLNSFRQKQFFHHVKMANIVITFSKLFAVKLSKRKKTTKCAILSMYVWRKKKSFVSRLKWKAFIVTLYVCYNHRS